MGIRLLLPDWDTLVLAALIIGLIAALVYFVLKWDMLKKNRENRSVNNKQDILGP